MRFEYLNKTFVTDGDFLKPNSILPF